MADEPPRPANPIDYLRAAVREGSAVVLTWISGLGLFVGLTVVGFIEWPAWAVVTVIFAGLVVGQYRVWSKERQLRMKASTQRQTVQQTHYHLGPSIFVGAGGTQASPADGPGGAGLAVETHELAAMELDQQDEAGED